MVAEGRVRSEWRTLETDNGDMRAYVAATTSSPRGAIVVLQEAFGVNAHVQSIANRFAASGYLAMAPDLFHRQDAGVVDYQDRDRAMTLIGELGPEEIAADVGAAVASLRDGEPALSRAVVGFCFGGRAAFTSACTVEGLEAAVMFYGPGVASGPHAVLDRAEGIASRMLLIYGAEDPTISAVDREAIEEALQAEGIEHSTQIYEDAGHAFFCDARPELFRAGPSLDAWERMSDFLAASCA
jgi:carboxymethylenebutenolidase